MLHLNDELQNVASAVNRLIQEDDFPAAIRPDYLRAAVLDYPARGGKRLRPALLLWSCRLLGGSEACALYPAAAVEVFHNWTLVHDDIIDDDNVRRGVPTCHRKLAELSAERFPDRSRSTVEKFGRDMAILAGDLQQAWANKLLLQSTMHGVSPALAVALANRMQTFACRELISGEALDVEFPMRRLETITATEVENMFYLKTGVLLRFAAETGGAIALDCSDFNRPEIKTLGDFAAAAGVAFQLRDDYLGMYGEFQTFGKAIGADLREGKPTLLLLKGLELLPESGKQELRELLHLAEYSGKQIERARTLFEECGAKDYVVRAAEQFAALAREKLNTFSPSPYKILLDDLTDYLLNRDI